MAHYLKGMDALLAHSPAEAEKEWILGTQQDPSEYHCYEQLGKLYTELHRWQEAAVYYHAAADRSPHDGSLYLGWAHAEHEQGDLPAALSAAKRAAELLPDDADAVGGYGLLEAAHKERRAALPLLRRAHQLRPDDHAFFIAMIQTELDNLDMASAERDLAPYLRSHPDDAEASYYMSVVYNQKPRTPENLQGAVGYAKQALKGMPHDPRVYSLMGQLLLDMNQPREALNIYSNGRRVAPRSDSILHGLVDCYARLGMTKEQDAAAAVLQKSIVRHDRIAHLNQVMSFNHSDVTAGLELARLEEEDNNDSLAFIYYTQLVRQAPSDPRTRPALSAFYKKLHQGEPAKKALQPGYTP